MMDAAPNVVGNETAAIFRLRTIGTAERDYNVSDGQGLRYANLDDLVKQGFLRSPSDGQLANYKFDVTLTEHSFHATAVPIKYGVSGLRSFYMDEQMVMHGADKKGEAAGPSDPAVN